MKNKKKLLKSTEKNTILSKLGSKKLQEVEKMLVKGGIISLACN